MCTMAGHGATVSTTQFTQNLSAGAIDLMSAALAPSSKLAYISAWRKFTCFLVENSLDPCFPLQSNLVLNFLANLHGKGFSHSSLKQHASVISFVQKSLGFSDIVDQFQLRNLLRGAIKIRGVVNTRLPIIKEILLRLLQAIPIVFSDLNHKLLLGSIFSLAFAGFFRIGELVFRSKLTVANLVQTDRVKFLFVNSKVTR